MKKILLFLFVILFSTSALAQFSVDAYKDYLKNHENMTFEQLLNEYPAGYFKNTAKTDFDKALYADTIDMKYYLTSYEKKLIENHGFMVSERLSYETFHEAFENIFHNDLPVYVSSDAILYAMHWTFDKMLQDIEKKYLIFQIYDALKLLHEYIPNLQKQSTDALYLKSLRDMDIYLTVARNLLGIPGPYSIKPANVKPYFKENEAAVNELNDYIAKENPVWYSLFSGTERRIDFSQMKPRGHYAADSVLKYYFRAMMWLGRTEIMISKPKQDGAIPEQTDEDIQRQNILAALIVESATETNAFDNLNNMEKVLNVLLGRSDNISCQEVENVMNKLKITHASELVNEDKWKEFQSELTQLSSASQLYNSQILYSDPYSPEQVEPPAAVLLVGQRAILDGYITANVVYDKIMFENKKIRRMLPSTLDILFALGNDASIQLLTDELASFPYSSNLAALRYLISAYDDTFWKSNCYTNWLNAIRTLNPPQDRKMLPPFMQTAAWWQKTMNTQLSSWAQLRHDFLLYAKQPYTAGIICSFPYSFVEPVPEFYRAVVSFAEKTLTVLEDVDFRDNIYTKHEIETRLGNFIEVGNTLAEISEKELNNEKLTDNEISFLQSMIIIPDPMCGAPLGGWYSNLFYGFHYLPNGQSDIKCDYLVADVHTAPTDANENDVGWVLHGGTGKLNMAVIVTKNHEGKDCSFIGPVMSYYECVTTNYQRLTDQEWATFHSSQAYRPNFTNLYLAGKQGEELGEKTMLFTDVEEAPVEISNNLQLLTFPNPFSTTTTIVFTVPPSQSNKNVELNIYDMQGRLVNQLINEPIPSGNYSSRWDGTDSFGNKVDAGVYLFVVKAGVVQNAGKVTLIGN